MCTLIVNAVHWASKREMHRKQRFTQQSTKCFWWWWWRQRRVFFSLSAFSCPLSSPTKSVFFAHSLCLSSDWYRSAESLVVFFAFILNAFALCTIFFFNSLSCSFCDITVARAHLTLWTRFFFSSFSNSNSTWNVIDIYYFSHWFTKKSNYGSDVTASWVRSVDSVARNFISIENSHSAFAETCPWHGTFIHTDVITLALSLSPFFLVIFWKCVCLCLYAIVRFLVICLFFLHFLCVFFRCKFLWAMIIPFSNYSFFYIYSSLCVFTRSDFFYFLHNARENLLFFSFNHANSRVWGAIIACWYLDRFNIRIGFVCL